MTPSDQLDWIKVAAEGNTVPVALRRQLPLLDQVFQLAASAEDANKLCDRMGKLLEGIANVLKGPPSDLVQWSWHDLPELAEAQRKALQTVIQVLGPAAPSCQGCSHEISEAIKAVESVGIEYKGRKKIAVAE